jgi:hypothetical protein
MVRIRAAAEWENAAVQEFTAIQKTGSSRMSDRTKEARIQGKNSPHD